MKYLLLSALLISFSSLSAREIPTNFANDKLAAWCIVPFDAKKRSPKERAEMLVRLGLKRCAYDWRGHHVVEFEDEILQYRKHGIEFFAFWGEHDKAFELFKKYDLHPQIWRTLGSPKSGSLDEMVKSAADSMEDLAKRTAELDCKLGLYNHGGWGGEPANLVAVCQDLHKRGYEHVGIVYNWHHGHGHIDDWGDSLALMKPWLHCLNLNGMNTGAKPKILTIGHGEHESTMLDAVIRSGYDGPISILDHQAHLDAEIALRNNLDGLEWLKKEWNKPGSGGEKPEAKAFPKYAESTLAAKAGSVSGSKGYGKTLAGGMIIEGESEWREPPITVECRVRLEDARGFNILVASDTKSSNAHWEIFSMNGSGQLTAYLPGANPNHVRSEKVITDNQWHQVAMQYASDQVTLWVDEEKVAEQTIALKPNRHIVPGGLAFGRLVKGSIGLRGAIDEVRIRKGIHPPFEAKESKVLGKWDFEDLSKLQAKAKSLVAKGLRPLEPEANPYWQEYINRDRIYDFYAKQARERPDKLAAFPGLDGGHLGHWGNQNDQTTWKDGRVKDMDHGSMISGVYRGTRKIVIPRAVTLKVSEDTFAVFDTDKLQFVEAWQGDITKWSDVRRGFMRGIPIGGKPVELETLKTSAANDAEYLGLYRSGERVIFAYKENQEIRYRSASLQKGKVVEIATRKPDSFDARWSQRIDTKGILGAEKPYAIDTLTLPFKNPWKSLFFIGGVDFVSANRIAICTIHGEVWICDVTGPELERLSWKRFAAGLHQPLGLKVVDGVIHVMCRDQITALVDLNGDDEADFYQSLSRVHKTSASAHDFITGLQRDSRGRWFFASGNQGVCRVSADGKELTQIAGGLRNPNGLGISSDGETVLTSVQEGSWTPASAITDISAGGHFGAGGPRDGERGFVPPMLYLPRGVDNSSGGQVYIDNNLWGPVKENWIHFSGGFAKYFLVLREALEIDSQAAAVALPGSFASGAHRGRFSPYDGGLYVAGAQGWGNYGVADGSLQRVRFSGGENSYPYPISWQTRDNGILLTFAAPQLDSLLVMSEWFAQHWNYRYGPAYGSPEYSVLDPNRKGHDQLVIRGVHKVGDGSQVFIEIPQLQPVDQLHIHFDGLPRIEMFATIHKLGEPFIEFEGYQEVGKTWGDVEKLTSANSKNPQVLMTACAACHHPENQLVGPALAEIRKRYANNPDGIVEWAMNPQNKNPQLPSMPSFQFLGKEKLRIIAEAILAGE